MSQEAVYVVPFRRWRRPRVEALLAEAQAALDVELTLDPPDEDEDDGSFIVRFVDRETLSGGTLVLESHEGDDDEEPGPASMLVELDGLSEEAVELASDVAEQLAHLVGGAHEDSAREVIDRIRARAAGEQFPTFDDLRGYLVDRWDADVVEERVYITWGWSNTERTQLVEIQETTLFGESWVYLRSRVGARALMNDTAALSISTDQPLATLVGTEVWSLVVCLPLAALGQPRLSAVIAHIAQEADDLEEKLVGTDEH